MPSLSREDAIRRAELIDIDSYAVSLDLTRGEHIFGSQTIIDFSCAEPGAETFIELDAAQLHSVELNGETLPISYWKNGRIRVPSLAEQNRLTVVADMNYSRSGDGMHRFVDPEDGRAYTYMMGFLDTASQVFACFEQPDLKAKYRLSVLAPVDWTVVANESGRQIEPGYWAFVESNPMATYFVTVVAGPYHSIHREYKGKEFGLHARQTYREALETDADEIFDITFKCWDTFHDLYGVDYAFGRSYDQCFVPEFNAGAMENPGCVTFRDEAFMYRSTVTAAQRESRATVIAHEMAHMWFGDLVTMKWWDDLWLNESFADYMGSRGAAEIPEFAAAKVKAIIAGLGGVHADLRSSSHPVSGTVAESGTALTNFDGISYQKGGEVLRQLVAWVGEEAFFTGIGNYLTEFRYGNASLQDLLRHLADASGKDLRDWGERWLRTCGPNTLQVEATVQDDRYTEVAVLQSRPPNSDTLRPHRFKLGMYWLRDGNLDREQVTIELDGDRVSVPELVGRERADLLLINDDYSTYARVRLQDDEIGMAARLLAAMTDDVSRAILWRALMDMAHDGRLAAQDYLDILSEALAHEPLVNQVTSQLGFAKNFVVDCCMDRAERTRALGQLVDLCEKLMDRSSSGNGIGLAALRARIGSTLDVGWLQDMASSDTVAGIELDDDLRWALQLRLVVLGAAGQEDIDARLAADSSSEGHKHALTCAAAIPTSEAKAHAWGEIMSSTQRSNHELRAIAAGFFWPEQQELLADYVPRFFTEGPEGIGARPPWDARMVINVMFPRTFVSADTVAHAEAMLARTDLHPLFRRGVSDSVDDMKQALAARRQSSEETVS